jgi:hypothetical protein
MAAEALGLFSKIFPPEVYLRDFFKKRAKKTKKNKKDGPSATWLEQDEQPNKNALHCLSLASGCSCIPDARHADYGREPNRPQMHLSEL